MIVFSKEEKAARVGGGENLVNGKGFCETPSVSMVFGPEPCTCSLALLVYLYIFS